MNAYNECNVHTLQRSRNEFCCVIHYFWFFQYDMDFISCFSLRNISIGLISIMYSCTRISKK